MNSKLIADYSTILLGHVWGVFTCNETVVCPVVGHASKLITAMYQLKKHLLILLLMFESACDETDAHTCTNCTQKPGVSSEFEWRDGCTSIRYVPVLHAQVRHEYVLRDGCTTSGLWGRAPAVFPPPGSLTKTSILFSITIIITPIIINNLVVLSFFLFPSGAVHISLLHNCNHNLPSNCVQSA